MTIQHNGFGDSSFDDVSWAQTAEAMMGPFRVADATVWRPLVGPGDRAVTIATGVGVCCGVRAYNDTTATVTFSPNSTTTIRYDAVVARFNWTTKSVDFTTIPGGGSPPRLELNTPGAGVINRIPGVQYDALIAIVGVRPSVGSLVAADIQDLRPRGGGGGTHVIDGSQWWEYVDIPEGALLQVRGGGLIQAEDYSFITDPAAYYGVGGYRLMARTEAGWRQVAPSVIGHFLAPFTLASGGVLSTNIQDVTTFTIPSPGPGVTFRAQLTVAFEGGSNQVGTRWDFHAGTGGGPGALPTNRLASFIAKGAELERIAPWYATGPVSGPLSGPQIFRLTAARVFGTAGGLVTEFNRRFDVTYFAA